MELNAAQAIFFLEYNTDRIGKMFSEASPVINSHTVIGCISLIFKPERKDDTYQMMSGRTAAD